MNIWKKLRLISVPMAMVLIGGLYANVRVHGNEKTFYDIPNDIIRTMFKWDVVRQEQAICDGEDVDNPARWGQVSKGILYAIEGLEEYKKYKELQKLALPLSFLAKKLVFAPDGFGPEAQRKPISISFEEAARKKRRFDIQKFQDQALDEYFHVSQSPRDFFEDNFERNIVLITTVGEIKKEEKRLRNVPNPYELGKLIEKWNDKWKKEDGDLHYNDRDLVVLYRWGNDSLREYKYGTVMVPRAELGKLGISDCSLWKLLCNEKFFVENGAGYRVGGWVGRWVLGLYIKLI